VDVLAVNAGSSSLKLRLVGGSDEVLAEADFGPDDAAALESFLDGLPAVDAAAHRFVHGGRLEEHALLDDAVLREIEAGTELAPLHTPLALACARELLRLLPDLPQVACLDTAFHRTLPEAAATYAVPAAWRERHGVRRRGYHGFSHAWASHRAAELTGRPLETLRTVTCHIGSGVSLAAVDGGRSVDTTMGMTPAEGPPMATRSGTIDPVAVLLLVEREGGADRVRELLERQSGLLGLSGASADVRELLASDDPAARLAIDVYVHRLRAAVASMAAGMCGLEALVFTAGVGENSAPMRAAVCDGLAFLGVALDPPLNELAEGDRLIGAPESAVAVAVVRAREELEMARAARAVLGG
jgi:acetate kinase